MNYYTRDQMNRYMRSMQKDIDALTKSMESSSLTGAKDGEAFGIAVELCKVDEGYSFSPYLCSEGYVTVGFGTKLNDRRGLDPDTFSITMSKPIAEMYLREKLQEIEEDLEGGKYSDLYRLAPARVQAVLLCMGYQLGYAGLTKFKRTLALLNERLYYEASVEMLDSLWARQTSNRARKYSDIVVGKTHLYLRD